MQTDAARCERESVLREKIRTEIEREIDARKFEYTDIRRCVVMNVVWFGFGGWVCVIGDPNNADYEWIARHDTGFADNGKPARYSHSNCAYGCGASALRDGLNAILD